MSNSILIVTGEASGDKHGANLALELKQSAPEIHISAMGGEALGNEALAQAKKLGIPVLFYISPKFWAWREKRVNRIKRLVDKMAVIFPFEVAFYEKNGVPVKYVGNPLAGKVAASHSKADSLKNFDLNANQAVIGIFPGSRRSEISRLLPIYLKVREQLQTEHPDAQYLLPLAPGVNQEKLEQWAKTNLPKDILLVSPDQIYDAMQCCDAAMVTMGTVTLEAALMKMPMLTANKVAGVSYHLLKGMVTTEYFTLANIVAEREVVKEFLQYEATPAALTEEINRILTDDSYRNSMTENLQQVKNKIGDDNGSANVAKLVLEMLGEGN